MFSIYQYLTLLCFNNMKAKHILMKYFTVKEYTDAGLLRIQYRSTKDMLGDILTKPLIGEQFVKLRKQLLNL